MDPAKDKWTRRSVCFEFYLPLLSPLSRHFANAIFFPLKSAKCQSNITNAEAGGKGIWRRSSQHCHLVWPNGSRWNRRHCLQKNKWIFGLALFPVSTPLAYYRRLLFYQGYVVPGFVPTPAVDSSKFFSGSFRPVAEHDLRLKGRSLVCTWFRWNLINIYWKGYNHHHWVWHEIAPVTERFPTGKILHSWGAVQQIVLFQTTFTGHFQTSSELNNHFKAVKHSSKIILRLALNVLTYVSSPSQIPIFYV